MESITKLTLCIKGGDAEEPLKSLLTIGHVPDGVCTVPSIMSHEPVWMITHGDFYTAYGLWAPVRTSLGTMGQLLVTLLLPPSQQLAKGANPLDVLNAVVGLMGGKSLSALQLSDKALDQSRFIQLLQRYELEERAMPLPVMAGKSPATFCVSNEAQLRALMRFSRYPVLAKVSRLELSYICASTIDLVTKIGGNLPPKDSANGAKVPGQQASSSQPQQSETPPPLNEKDLSIASGLMGGGVPLGDRYPSSSAQTEVHSLQSPENKLSADEEGGVNPKLKGGRSLGGTLAQAHDSKGKKNKKRLLIIGAILLLLVLLVAIVGAFSEGRGPESSGSINESINENMDEIPAEAPAEVAAEAPSNGRELAEVILCRSVSGPDKVNDLIELRDNPTKYGLTKAEINQLNRVIEAYNNYNFYANRLKILKAFYTWNTLKKASEEIIKEFTGPSERPSQNPEVQGNNEMHDAIPMPPEPLKEDVVFKSAAHMPSFPGGDAALINFINKNICYPQEAQDNGVQGNVVVQFVVEKDGRIGEVRVARGVDKDLDREAVRICKMLPKFSPGRNANGDPVRVWYTLPVTFKLQG